MTNCIIKRTIKSIIVVDTLMMALLILCITTAHSRNDNLTFLDDLICIFVFLLFAVVMDILMFKFLKKVYTEKDEMHRSKMVVNQSLIKKQKVKPLNSASVLKKFSNIGKFYAVKEDNDVVIFFENSNESILIEKINPKFFTYYYQILKD